MEETIAYAVLAACVITMIAGIIAAWQLFKKGKKLEKKTNDWIKDLSDHYKNN
jgi:H+/gluconate symporter-like permease